MLGQYILKRLILAVMVLFGTSVLTFVVVRVVPGDPARMVLPPQAGPEDVAAARERMGLDQPYIVQYNRYIIGLLHGDFGYSYHTGRTVLEEFITRLPATIELSILSLFLAAVIGIWLGVECALHQNGVVDHVARVFSITGVSAPSFWIGLLAIYVFYYKLGWAPAPTGRVSLMTAASLHRITGFVLLDAVLQSNWKAFGDALAHLALPTLTLAYTFLAMICRLTRAGMLEVLRQDYIQFAETCGIRRIRIIWQYALRNGIRPVLTMLGLFFAQLLGGVVFIETVFNWPGIGRFAVESISYLDYSSVQGFLVFMAMVYVLMNLVVDILYMAIDPRVRY